MKKLIITIIALSSLSFFSCKNTSEKTTVEDADTTKSVAKMNKIKMDTTSNGPEFPNAMLTVESLTGKPIPGTDSLEMTIKYVVKGYELKAQTSDAAERNCANSKEGQHIHFIQDNEPYSALYEPKHTFKVAKNSEHTILSFLSRSYHLSLKNSNASVLYKYKVDDKGNVTPLDNPSVPMLFYSRPKGTYVGKDTANLLLDFYILNTDLSVNGNKVKVKIAEEEFIIEKWQPYFINNLPLGEQTITLSLIDKDGNEVEGPFTTVSRKITLAESEPIK